MMRAGHRIGIRRSNLSPDLVGRDGERGEPKGELRRAAAKLPHGATRIRPIAGGKIANVASKFRSGAELLSFSVTAGR
jgi:hypothetical protein